MNQSVNSTGPIHLYIGTPCYGGQATSLYFTSLLQLEENCARSGFNLTVLTLWGDALITRARQNIVACFLEDPTSTHLLFIDSDIGFDPRQVFRLLHIGKDIVSAPYPNKPGSLPLVPQAEVKTVPDSKEEFVKVPFARAGFLMIRRQALLAMMQKYPQLKYSGGSSPMNPLKNSSYLYSFFNCQIDGPNHRYLPEDESFCRLWTEMGGEIWADTQSRLVHLGIQGVQA